MSEEELARLFTPFSTAFDGGTGLGMAIVRRIVEDHGGAIDAESRPGEGTTVTVLLPRDRSAKPAPDAGGLDSPGGGGMSGPRLLIVDDESSIRDMLAIFFHKRGFEVVTASSFAEGTRGRRALEPGPDPLRHQDARRQRARPAAQGQGGEPEDARDHDHGAHLDARTRSRR